MDNLKNPYLSPRIKCVMFSTQRVIATSPVANDSLSDFDETTPSWTIDE